ncbi:MAG: segregation/condensation protein A [Bacilli bacterium]|jgi:segregation and condensation protein A|nr:segregation/condensation protein A [Bacilli bacterium]
MKQIFHLNDFEGPLDLLIHLIKENKMSIFDIEINVIIAQYIALINEAKEINLEIASEFLVMASSLLEIKSKQLLPKTILDIEDEYEEDIEDELTKRLVEYYRFKEVSNNLNDNFQERLQLYTKPLSDLKAFSTIDTSLDLPEHIDVNDLIMAMDKIMERYHNAQPVNSVFENNELSVEEVSNKILAKLSVINNYMLLDDLVTIKNKTNFIVTFIAILDLVKQHQVIIKQDLLSKEIYISGVV